MASRTEPKLAAPGAGLPALELFVGRRMFARKLRTRTRADFDRQFGEERAAIRQRVEGCAARQRGERVLIRRLRGLEDSSRFWSVWMTLDHLRICHEAFAGIIEGLAAGRAPEAVASTADVKPSPDVGPEVEGAYEASCDALLAAVGRVPDLATVVRYAHPWFGPLDAAGWHALAALHMAIHRGQIERIVEALPR